jgi:hypothetical protein
MASLGDNQVSVSGVIPHPDRHLQYLPCNYASQVISFITKIFQSRVYANHDTGYECDCGGSMFFQDMIRGCSGPRKRFPETVDAMIETGFWDEYISQVTSDECHIARQSEAPGMG